MNYSTCGEDVSFTLEFLTAGLLLAHQQEHTQCTRCSTGAMLLCAYTQAGQHSLLQHGSSSFGYICPRTSIHRRMTASVNCAGQDGRLRHSC